MNTIELKSIWVELLTQFEIETAIQERLWTEIEKHYSGKNRHYHNLIHLEKMMEAYFEHIDYIKQKETILFSIFYHDIIYQPIRRDNEEKSAKLMKNRLEQIQLPQTIIENCYRQIMQTKTHRIFINHQEDDKYLLDFDLEVLSRNWEAYKTYTEQIRKEYWIYPISMYKKGRRSAMLSFLKRDSIYHTAYFKREKEESARQNILRELEEILN